MDKKITYPRNFLTKVLFRIDFTPLEALKSEPTEFRNLIRSAYPRLEPVVRTGALFEAQVGMQPTTRQVSETLWQFTSTDGTTLCNVLFNSVVIESNAYINFTTFATDLKVILDAFYAIYPDVSVIRVGLRYINEIVVPDGEDYLEWGELINPQLASIVRFRPEGTELKRSLNGAEYVVDADTTINVRTGIYNSSYPAAIVRKEFVIDLDCYSTSRPDSQTALMTSLNRYNDLLTRTFESIIEDGLRALLSK